MAKWSKEELLCNSRGLDDGYLFVHSSHQLAAKLKPILQPGKTAKAPKTRLSDAASYGCPGFTGSVRPPLSNEIHPLDSETVVKGPSTSTKSEFSSLDNLFVDPIYGNDTLCVAFTEPPKLSHKSILIPGAILVPPCLSEEDKRIRRPRLNRGGGTIANLGTSNGQSHKSGYGSMNIGSYERDLAQRTGRGNQMYQAGTRAWGAMEPAPKRVRAPNPFQNQGGTRAPMPPQNRPPWQQQQNSGYGYGQQQYGQQQQQRPPHQGQQQGWRHQGQQHQYSQNHNQRYPQQHRQQGGYQQGRSNHPQGSYQNYPHQNRQHQAPPPNHQRHGGGPPRSAQGGQGFNFRSIGQQGASRGAPQRPPPPPPTHASTQVNSNVMNSLKAQLASTLKQNRRPNDRR